MGMSPLALPQTVVPVAAVVGRADTAPLDETSHREVVVAVFHRSSKPPMLGDG